MFEDISKFEENLNLPIGFYTKLLEEDDWSFVIKLSALFEAACTHILSVRLRAPELEASFAFLDQANTKYGKLLLLKKLNAVNSNQYKFLERLASLRNELAHRVENVNFTFSSYINNLDKNQKISFVKFFAYNYNDPVEINDKSIPKNEFVINNPKLAIWNVASDIFACLYVEIEAMKLKSDQEGLNWYKNNLTSGSS